MAERKSTKRLITEAVLRQLPEPQPEIESIISAWWMTSRQEGLRLTALGDSTFQLAGIEFYECALQKIPSGSWYNFLREVNQKIKCPYYLHVSTKSDNKKGEPFIRLYDSKIAMMLTLYGDIHEYLNAIPGRKVGHSRD